LFRSPILNRKFKLPADYPVMTDDDIRDLIEHYVNAAILCDKAGAPFVDIKQCHGYLGHEFLSAYTRKGPYGGETLEERSTFAREIIQAIRQAAPKLIIGVRLSAFDFVPFRPDPLRAGGGNLGPGIPEDFSECLPYRYGFGIDKDNPPALRTDRDGRISEAALVVCVVSGERDRGFALLQSSYPSSGPVPAFGRLSALRGSHHHC